jgi:hypothetical protein
MINDEELIRLRDQYPELSITRKVAHVPYIVTASQRTRKSSLFDELLESTIALALLPPIRISFEDEMNRLDRLMANGLSRGEMFNPRYQCDLFAEMVWEEPEELPVAKKRRERNQFNGLNANGLPSSKAKRRGGQ